MSGLTDSYVPEPVRAELRGIGQIFFAENALTGFLFVLGIVLSSPLMAAGLVVGSVIGTVTARVLKFDAAEISAGIYGFNSALVGIAAFFFFKPGPLSLALLVGGCVLATFLTRLMRRHVPFPTYTTPFIVTTWLLFFLGTAIGAARVEPGGPMVGVGFAQAVAHGVSQVMFQASVLTALLFLIGIAISDWRHASWVLVGSFVGALVASFHATAAARVLDPESLVERSLPETIALGLYGYNATLAAIALFLGKRSFIPPLLGILISVPLTEFVPMLGLPALTAPFVLATWLVLGLAWLEGRYFGPSAPPTP
ncbi:urea transporter [Tundrisphaera lichenicola]|uniref:urea transporter n=1 Tax=Tundrisphaera lichenicola TaxID=2029860 RepID=UPI003EBD4F92